MRLGPQGDRGDKPAPFYESAEPNISAASYFGMACLAEHTRRLVGATFASVNLVRTRLSAGGRWIRACMGLPLSSGCLGCADSFLFGAGKAVFRPVAWDQVRGARGRGQGTETVAQLGGLPPSGACVSHRLAA